jgi:hypothetical protein
MDSVRRFDRVDLGTVTRKEDGSITSEAVITTAGVYKYRLPDGTVQKEFRSPEEVFKADTMASAQMMPITNNHPPTVFVDPTTAKQLSVGFTGQDVRRSDDSCVAPIKIHTKEGIQAVDGGRRQFSCGYSARVIKQDGQWKGEPYTHAQVDIKYNHLALVDQGRAGPIASLRLDAADACMISDSNAEPADPPEPKGTKRMSSKVRLDNGLSYDCADEVAVEFRSLKSKVEATQTKLDASIGSLESMTAERDKLKGVSEELQKKVDGHEKELAEKIQAGVAERSTVLDSARKIITDDEEAKKLDAMSIPDIKKAVILAHDADADLEGKNESHLDGMFEVIVGAGKPSKQGQNGSAIVGDGSGKGRKADSDDDAGEQARLDGIEKMKEESRAPIGGAAK